jgi:hypothetical protein
VGIHNSFEVSVINCFFKNNGPVVIPIYVPARGLSAGLSISFNSTAFKLTDRTHLTVLVSGSTFCNNSIHTALSNRQTTSQVLKQFLLTGRGGGIIITAHSNISVNALVVGCKFERNFAPMYGGGAYVAWTLVANHTVHISHSSFIGNECPGGGGGIEIGFGETGPEERANRFYASNLNFSSNTATYGGGAHVFIAC